MRFLFGCRGRIGRAEMLIFVPFTLGWAFLAASIWYTQFSDLEGAVEDLGWEAVLPTLLDPLPHLIATIVILGLIILWCMVASAIIVKRLHDRDWSGYWLLLLMTAPVTLIALAVVMPPPPGPTGFAEGALAALALVIMLAFLRELFFLPGTKGENRFGPPN